MLQMQTGLKRLHTSCWSPKGILAQLTISVPTTLAQLAKFTAPTCTFLAVCCHMQTRLHGASSSHASATLGGDKADTTSEASVTECE